MPRDQDQDQDQLIHQMEEALVATRHTLRAERGDHVRQIEAIQDSHRREIDDLVMQRDTLRRERDTLRRERDSALERTRSQGVELARREMFARQEIVQTRMILEGIFVEGTEEIPAHPLEPACVQMARQVASTIDFLMDQHAAPGYPELHAHRNVDGVLETYVSIHPPTTETHTRYHTEEIDYPDSADDGPGDSSAISGLEVGAVGAIAEPINARPWPFYLLFSWNEDPDNVGSNMELQHRLENFRTGLAAFPSEPASFFNDHLSMLREIVRLRHHQRRPVSTLCGSFPTLLAAEENFRLRHRASPEEFANSRAQIYAVDYVDNHWTVLLASDWLPVGVPADAVGHPGYTWIDVPPARGDYHVMGTVTGRSTSHIDADGSAPYYPEPPLRMGESPDMTQGGVLLPDSAFVRFWRTHYGSGIALPVVGREQEFPPNTPYMREGGGINVLLNGRAVSWNFSMQCWEAVEASIDGSRDYWNPQINQWQSSPSVGHRGSVTIGGVPQQGRTNSNGDRYEWRGDAGERLEEYIAARLGHNFEMEYDPVTKTDVTPPKPAFTVPDEEEV